MDPLSDILTMLTVERMSWVRFETTGPYAMRFQGFDHIKFGAVLSGSLRLKVDGMTDPRQLEAGDCYLQTDGRPYRSGNADDTPELDGNLFSATHKEEDSTIRFGDGPPDKVVIGGQFRFDPEGAAWLRSALPPFIHIAAASPTAAPLRATLALLGSEAGGGSPGEAVIVDRLADILLVQALRAHLAAAGPQDASWLAGLSDPRIGRALRGFHGDVAADWTVARLAALAGMSRSSLAKRFHARVGMAPLDYLTRWRMHRVRRALLDSQLPFGTIAARNGYRSRTSCSQAFKRMFGYSPHALRKERRNGPSAEPDRASIDRAA